MVSRNGKNQNSFYDPDIRATAGRKKVLVNLVNNLNKRRFDVTVLALFDGGVNKPFLKPWIKFRACMPHTFRGNIHVLKIFSPSQLYKHFIHENYDIVVSYLEGPTARIISGCSDENTKMISWIHVEQLHEKKLLLALGQKKRQKNVTVNSIKTVCVAETVKMIFVGFFLMSKNVRCCTIHWNQIRL